MTRPAIIPYQPAWPAEFQAIAAAQRQALGGLALRIDHIGSTSVPGLPAKDVIDVQVSVAALEAAAAAAIRAALGSLGYRPAEGLGATTGRRTRPGRMQIGPSCIFMAGGPAPHAHARARAGPRQPALRAALP